MKHVMIDLETLSTKPDAVFATVGLVQFDIKTGKTGMKMHMKLDIQSCINAGRKIDASTLKWWFGQGEEAKEALFSGETLEYTKGLEIIRKFFKEVKEESYSDPIVWSNGSNFDIAILENAFKNDNNKIPWKFYNIRDVRTLTYLGKELGINYKDFTFEGTPHNACDDALHQVKYCSAIWQKVKGKE